MVLLVWIQQALGVRTSSLILNTGRDEAEAGARSIAIEQRGGVKSEEAIATCYEKNRCWGVAATKFVLELDSEMLLLAARRRRRTVITDTQETSRRQGRRWLRAMLAKKEGCMRVLTHLSSCSSSC